MTGALAGRSALVTGGSRGIGRAIALALADAGARVAICHNDDPRAAATRANLCARMPDCFAVAADVSREADVLALFGEIDGRFGGLDIAISNAGILAEVPTLETSGDAFDAVIGVNLRGAFLTCREAARRMLARPAHAAPGRIIAIASDLAFLGRARMAAYCASKGGVIALTRSLAHEFAPRILVNAIAPGPIDTDMTRPAAMSPAAIAQDLATPLARFGAPEDVANLALFLAGDGARFVTGQCFGVNGGSVMR